LRREQLEASAAGARDALERAEIRPRDHDLAVRGLGERSICAAYRAALRRAHGEHRDAESRARQRACRRCRSVIARAVSHQDHVARNDAGVLEQRARPVEAEVWTRAGTWHRARLEILEQVNERGRVADQGCRGERVGAEHHQAELPVAAFTQQRDDRATCALETARRDVDRVHRRRKIEHHDARARGAVAWRRLRAPARTGERNAQQHDGDGREREHEARAPRPGPIAEAGQQLGIDHATPWPGTRVRPPPEPQQRKPCRQREEPSRTQPLDHARRCRRSRRTAASASASATPSGQR
jgi:hypothetical protein